jgi:hypothetical protein
VAKCRERLIVDPSRSHLLELSGFVQRTDERQVGELIHFLIGVPEVTGATTIFSRSGGSFRQAEGAQNSSRLGCMTVV